MLFISENLLLKYLEANDKYKLDEFINKKTFTVSDTPLTYRQVNALDSDQLLSKDRENKQGWRKFSFKELTYVLIVNELKKFGLKHDQLRQVWSAFLAEPTPGDRRKIGEVVINKGISDVVIGLVFSEVEIILTVDSEGKISFYDPGNYAVFYQSEIPQIQISLNVIVNKILKTSGKPTFPIKWSVSQMLLDGVGKSLSEKEGELLKIIRNEDYSALRIRKKNGEITLVSAEKSKNENHEVTTKDLLKLIDTNDFQDVSIVKRDGKIVNYKVEEAIKL